MSGNRPRRRKLRWITICEADGAYCCEVRAAPGDEQRRCKPGQFWIEGQTDGAAQWINPATRRRNTRREPRVTLAQNRISGLPEGAAVRFRGRLLTPDENGAVTFDPQEGLPEDIDVTIDAPNALRRRVKVPCRALADAERTGLEVRFAQAAAKLRRAAYPPIEEQLDAFWKGGSEADAMRDRVRAVKQKFPKIEKEPK